MEIGNEYRLYFEIKPKIFRDQLANVILLTSDTGGKFLGIYRTVGYFQFYRNSDEYQSSFTRPELYNLTKIGEWVSFEISQVYNGKNFIYTIRYNSSIIVDVITTLPLTIRNVKVYISSAKLAMQPGLIRHLRFTNIY